TGRALGDLRIRDGSDLRAEHAEERAGGYDVGSDRRHDRRRGDCHPGILPPEDGACGFVPGAVDREIPDGECEGGGGLRSVDPKGCGRVDIQYFITKDAKERKGWVDLL